MVGAVTSLQTSQVTRVLVADSTRMSCQLLCDALRRCHRLNVTGASNPLDVLKTATSFKPHVAVISANLDEDHLKGFKVSRQLRASHPETKVVMLLDSSRRDLVVEAFRAGAKGVFCRAESIKSLCRCISSVHRGQIWANSNEMQFVLEALAESAPLSLVDAKGTALLSKRELDVVRCVADGLTNREIAAQLKLSEHTVKNYLFRVFDKLGVSSRVEMILYAFSQRASAETSRITPELSGNFPQDAAKTFEWYRKAAEQGFGVAQFILGQMYRDGYGVPQDKLSAYVWFHLAECTSNYIGKSVRDAKDRLARRMKADQIAEAQRRASEWLKQHPSQAKLLSPSRAGAETKTLPTAPALVR